MMEPILQRPLISRYALKAKGFLNSLTKRSFFEGALIQVNGGYGCIHPWPELGDPTLDQCLADLAGPRRKAIVRRALRCAEYDRVARQFDHSLFEEMEVPMSHATVVKLHAGEIESAVAAGFEVVKIKMGRMLSDEKKFLEEMVLAFPGLKWRLDFNEALEADEFKGFYRSLSERVQARVDFVEDPCPYGDRTWAEMRRELGVYFAVDREAAPLSGSAAYMVVKPAIDEPYLLGEAAVNHLQRVVVTSYMDHPVGQAFAAWEASRLGLQFPNLVDVCGLQTHQIFEKTAFSEALGAWGPAFQVPDGLGIGFDDLLGELVWTRNY